MASEEFDFKHNNFDIVRVRVVDLFGGYKEHKQTQERENSQRFVRYLDFQIVNCNAMQASSITIALHFTAHKGFSVNG